MVRLTCKSSFPVNSAGTLIAYYNLRSDGISISWDGIDFEFLKNLSGDPYVVHTNVYTQRTGGREQQFNCHTLGTSSLTSSLPPNLSALTSASTSPSGIEGGFRVEAVVLDALVEGVAESMEVADASSSIGEREMCVIVGGGPRISIYIARLTCKSSFPGNSAGTLIAYYLRSDGISISWNGIGFEFLENLSGDPYVIRTNVYTQRTGGREQQFYFWFDPILNINTYSILWDLYTMFYIDGRPIREFKNLEGVGVPYPNYQPMKLYSSLSNADDWATRGGLVKTDWSQAPFTASFKNLKANGCVWSNGVSSCNLSSSNSSDNNNSWLSQQLDSNGARSSPAPERNAGSLELAYCGGIRVGFIRGSIVLPLIVIYGEANLNILHKVPQNANPSFGLLEIILLQDLIPFAFSTMMEKKVSQIDKFFKHILQNAGHDLDCSGCGRGNQRILINRGNISAVISLATLGSCFLDCTTPFDI
ncbi:hypothetical protein AHAS_Ahas19G0373200 [Arachis hypogaea]